MLVEGHWFVGSAVAAIDSDAFAAELVGQFEGLVDGGGCGIFPEIYRLADGGVTVLLESGLHFDVPFGLNIISTFENFAYAGWNFGDFLDTSGFGNLIFEFFVVKAFLSGDLFEDRINLEYF